MVLTLILFYSTARSQGYAVAEYFRDIAGTPFFPRTYTDVTGNPYLFDDFQKSLVTLYNGEVLKDIMTNFNLISGELLYVDENGKTMIATSAAVKSVEVATRKFIPTPARNVYCEVMSTEGKATLLRIYKKRIVETKAFNSATAQKDFVINESYVLLADNKLTEVKSVKDLYEVLIPADTLKEFSKQEKLRPKSEVSWVKIVDYYNAI